MTPLVHEARIAFRDPLFRIACVLIAVLTITALWNGRQFQLGRDAVAAAEVERSLEKRERARDVLREEASGAVPVNPWGVSEPTRADWNAARPSGPLAALSFGREDVEPLSANVSLWMVRPDNLFRKHEFGSPLVMSAGRFDAGFLVVLLLPMFILALSYSVLAEERETGRLRLSMVQGSIAGRLALRLALRMSPVALALAAIVGTALSWGLPPDRLAWWSLGAGAYLAFWAVLAVVIATVRARQEVIALTGAAAWLAIVVILPALSVAAAQTVSPSPSAFTIINGARSASLAANRRLMENLDSYVSDHPELMSGEPTESDWAAKLYVSQQVISEEVQPVMDEARDRTERQARLLSAFRFVSPAAAVDDLMTESAGTGRNRQSDYVAQVRTFLARWQVEMSPLIFSRARLTADDVDDLPRFAYREPPIASGATLASILYLLALALAIAGIAIIRLRAVQRAGPTA